MKALRSLPSGRLIAQQTGWLGATSCVQLIGGLVHILFATRILGADGFGALAVITATAGLIHGVLAMPSGHTVITFASKSLADQRPREASALVRFVTCTSLGTSALAVLVICAVAFLAGDLILIDDAHSSALMLYGVVGFFLTTIPPAFAVLRMANRLRERFLAACADNLVRAAILTAIWMLDGGLVAVVLSSVAGAAVHGTYLLVAGVLSAPAAGIVGLTDSHSMRVSREAARFHFTIFGRTTIGALAYNLDSVLLAQFVGASDVGLYRAARYVVDLARRPFDLLNGAVQPVLSRLWFDRQGTELRDTVRLFTVASATLAASGLGLLLLVRSELAILFFGADFAGVAPLLLALTPGAFVSCLVVPATLPITVGRSLAPLVSSTSALIALVVATWLLVPTYGVDGGAWARTTSTVAPFVVLLPSIVSVLRASRRL